MFGFFRRQNPNFKDDGSFLLAKVLTSRNREVIDVRISKTSEMSPSEGGYFVRKTLVGPESFDQAVLEISTNRSHRVKNATVDGGELLPVKEW